MCIGSILGEGVIPLNIYIYMKIVTANFTDFVVGGRVPTLGWNHLGDFLEPPEKTKKYMIHPTGLSVLGPREWGLK
jgi:hypothetical protein